MSLPSFPLYILGVVPLLMLLHSYIIETCHEAASVAHHARRAKIKLDDFKFMLRRDTTKLGRVSEMLERDKDLKKQRKAFETEEGEVAKGVEKENVDEPGDKGGKGATGAAKSDAGSGSKRGRGDDGEKKEKKKRKKNKDGTGGGREDASTVRSG